MNNLDTTYTSDPSSTAAALGMLGVFTIPFLIYIVLAIVGLWKVFTKAGQPGWAAIVPIYNVYILLKIADKPAWWLLGLLLGVIPVIGPILGVVWGAVVGLEVGRKFGRSDAFGVILNGILGIGYLIIGFGSSKYNPNAKPAVGPTGTPTSTPAA